jgi:hypothetical protein
MMHWSSSSMPDHGRQEEGLKNGRLYQARERDTGCSGGEVETVYHAGQCEQKRMKESCEEGVL